MKSIIAFLIIGIINPLIAADWPNWQGPNFNGVSSEEKWDPDKIGNVIWKSKVGIGFSGVAVADGRIFTLGHGGKRRGGSETVYCLDAKSGKKIWSDTYAAELLPNLHEGGPAATPTVHKGIVYTLGKDGKLKSYNAKNGKRVWQRDVLKDSEMSKPAAWGFAGSPLVAGDSIIVEAAHTISYSLKDGEILWKSDRYKPAYASPVAFKYNDKDLIITLKTEGLLVLDANTGKTVTLSEWKTRFSTNATTPIVIGNEVFISTGYGRGCALYKFDGTSLNEVYTNKSISNHMANCVVIDGYLYGITGNTHGAEKKELVCMDFETGKVKWKEGGFGCGTITAASNRLIVFSERGELAVGVASPEKFESLSREQVNRGRCWTVPVLSNGIIYTRNATGNLVSIGVGEEF
jgi:outer membrane protein assembly factor BamB